jgi:hypothetical protein
MILQDLYNVNVLWNLGRSRRVWLPGGIASFFVVWAPLPPRTAFAFRRLLRKRTQVEYTVSR